MSGQCIKKENINRIPCKMTERQAAQFACAINQPNRHYFSCGATGFLTNVTIKSEE